MDNQVRITTTEIVEREAYEEWQNTMRSEQVEAATPEASAIVPQWKTVIEKLRSYPILEKSPLETQQFVLNLQNLATGLFRYCKLPESLMPGQSVHPLIG